MVNQELKTDVEVEVKPQPQTALKNATDALNEIILSDDLNLDEKTIIKIIRFKQWLIDQKK